MLGSDPAGPGGIPKILAAGIAIIGVLLIVGSFLLKKEGKGKPFFTRSELLVTVALTAISVAYILLLPVLGYLIVTPLLIASILVTLGRRKPLPIVLISVIGTLVLFLLFYSLLRVNLPLGFMRTTIDSLGIRL